MGIIERFKKARQTIKAFNEEGRAITEMHQMREAREVTLHHSKRLAEPGWQKLQEFGNKGLDLGTIDVLTHSDTKEEYWDKVHAYQEQVLRPHEAAVAQYKAEQAAQKKAEKEARKKARRQGR